MSIVVKGLAYAHPNGNQVFQHLNLAVGPGQKAALVGPNGAGKSTLLRLLTGQLVPTAGTLTRAETPYFVPQHLGQYDELSIAQALGVADKLAALHAILAGSAAEQHFAALDDDWEIEERVAAALAGWQLPALDLAQPLHTLSGGEKTKVFLAGMQVHAPALVLLDEPSNHLDTLGRARLYELIEQSRATLLVVSHDRALLNRLNLTLELGPDGVTSYGGNYDFYQAQREGQLQAWQNQLEEKEKAQRLAQQKARELTQQRHKQEARGKRQKLRQGVPRIVLGALKSQAEQSTAHLRETQQARLQDLGQELQQLRQQIREQTPLKLSLRASALHQGKLLVDAAELNFGYGPRPLWPGGLTFQLRSGERLRLSGANGAGKTTLLRLLTGQLAPTAGTLTRTDFRHVYLDQEYSVLDGALTVFEQVQARNARQLPEHELKTLLHHHQLGPAFWTQPSAGLSGGEKLKLLLCCLAVADYAPDLLILDEPTNNLDRISQQVLTQAVQGFTGAVLLISHDEHFVQEVGVGRTLRLNGQ